MKIEDKIVDKFELVTKAWFAKEDNFEFLKVEVNLTNLDELAKLSRQINEFVDQEDKTDKQYFLDIFSPGTDKAIDLKNINDYVGKNMVVVLKKHIKEKDSFEGEILSSDNDELIIRWNAKGQFRKQVIEFNDIKEVMTSSKIKKVKNGNK